MLPKEKAKLTGDLSDIEIQNLSHVDLLDLIHTMKRHADFEEHQLDYKHAMHLVRLLRMGYEAVTQGEILVKRPDAKELLDIRFGKKSYEEIVAYAEEMERKVFEEGKVSKVLQHSPDLKLAAKVTMEVQDMVWKK